MKFTTSVSVYCVLPLVLTLGAARVSAQSSFKRQVNVTVTDPLNRFVTGLGQGNFEIVENGVRRAITDFSAGAPMLIAIVSNEALPALAGLDPQDELIQARSVPEALQRLAASKNSRKVIVTLAPMDLSAIPSGIQTLQTNPAMLAKWVIELRNQYRLEFESSAPSANVEVLLRQPANLPNLTAHWK
jgi:hypothetical protein